MATLQTRVSPSATVPRKTMRIPLKSIHKGVQPEATRRDYKFKAVPAAFSFNRSGGSSSMPVLQYGWLWKRKPHSIFSSKKWTRKYCVLHDSKLFFYNHSECNGYEPGCGVIDLSACREIVLDMKRYAESFLTQQQLLNNSDSSSRMYNFVIYDQFWTKIKFRANNNLKYYTWVTNIIRAAKAVPATAIQLLREGTEDTATPVYKLNDAAVKESISRSTQTGSDTPTLMTSEVHVVPLIKCTVLPPELLPPSPKEAAVGQLRCSHQSKQSKVIPVAAVSSDGSSNIDDQVFRTTVESSLGKVETITSQKSALVSQREAATAAATSAGHSSQRRNPTRVVRQFVPLENGVAPSAPPFFVLSQAEAAAAEVKEGQQKRSAAKVRPPGPYIVYMPVEEEALDGQGWILRDHGVQAHPSSIDQHKSMRTCHGIESLRSSDSCEWQSSLKQFENRLQSKQIGDCNSKFCHIEPARSLEETQSIAQQSSSTTSAAAERKPVVPLPPPPPPPMLLLPPDVPSTTAVSNSNSIHRTQPLSVAPQSERRDNDSLASDAFTIGSECWTPTGHKRCEHWVQKGRRRPLGTKIQESIEMLRPHLPGLQQQQQQWNLPRRAPVVTMIPAANHSAQCCRGVCGTQQIPGATCL